MSELFSSILIPGFFLLACILQLHYFHQPFMQLTDLEHVRLPGARPPRWAHRCAPGLRSQPPASAVPGGCNVPPRPGTEEGREGGRWFPRAGPELSEGLSCPLRTPRAGLEGAGDAGMGGVCGADLRSWGRK